MPRTTELGRSGRSALSAPAALATALLLAGAPAASAVATAQAAAAEPSPAPEETPATLSTSENLHALFAAEWERQMRENPTWASALGDRRYNNRWEDRSLAAIEASHRLDGEVLEALAAIDPQRLPAADRLNYELFHRQYEEAVEGHRFRTFLMPVGHTGGVQTADELHESLRFQTLDDYEDWIARLEAIDTLVEQDLALMRQGIETGIVPPRVIMERVPDQIRAQIVDDPAESPFYDPFREMPEDLPAAERRRLDAGARRAISEIVVPAYEELLAFFTTTYLPATRESVGAWDLPDGEELYAFRVRTFTTTDLRPDEIHEIGLAEVRRIRGEMEAIIEEVGFEGSFAEFLEHLRSDPKFYYQDPEELLEAYRATAKRIDPELVKLFGRLPRTPYGVRPIPETIAPDTTTAYYNDPAADGSRAGYYYVNLYKPETRPKYEIEVLTVHEAVPGHHLQIALQQELGDLPNFRRYGLGFTAFVEGWGLYSESLGDDLGLYEDPYSKFGQLTYEMWRAVRLVVDTGLHARKWTRQQAIDLFKENAAKTELDIVNEIDRYIGWPGQALAYKIGELKIKELRTRAEERLGERFDIKAFHDTVLENGAVPLEVLEQKVEAWIAGAGGGERPASR